MAISTQLACVLSLWRAWTVLAMVSVEALAKEPILISSEVPSPVEDEPLFDVDVTSRLPLIRKRARRLSGDTIISSTEAAGPTSEPDLEGPRLAKAKSV